MGQIVVVNNASEEALAAATAESILKVIAPSTQELEILAWGVSFDGVSPTAEPVQVQLVRYSDAGTWSTTVTPVKWNPSTSAAIQSTAKEDCTVEPTVSAVLDYQEVHPQGGTKEFYPIGEAPVIAASGGVGIKCTAPAAVNVVGHIRFRE